MNPVKNLMEIPYAKVVKKGSIPVSNIGELTEGLCTTCDNKAHCLWRQNNKVYCQHFE